MRSALTWLTSLLLAAVLVGCASVIPQVSGPKTPGFSGNARTSGIAWTVDGRNHINAETRGRYNALIGVYGKGIAERRFLPPLTPDYGLTRRDASSWWITDQAAIYLGMMNGWKASAKVGL